MVVVTAPKGSPETPKTGMGFFAWYASASSATATQFKNLRAVPKICVHCKGEGLSAAGINDKGVKKGQCSVAIPSCWSL